MRALKHTDFAKNEWLFKVTTQAHEGIETASQP